MMRAIAGESVLCSVTLAAGLCLGPAQGQPVPVARELRLTHDQQALRARIEVLESSGSQADLAQSVAALIERKTPAANFIDLDGWAVARAELRFVHDMNRPASQTKDRPILALDFDLENHPFHVISRYARELQERGIDLLVVPVPNRAQIWGDRLPGGPAKTPGGGGDIGTARLLLALSEAGVEVVDLIPAFMAERARRRHGPLFRAYNPHWAPRAVVVAADALAERVAQMEWFEPGPACEGVDFFSQSKRFAHPFRTHGSAPEEPPTFRFELVLDDSGERVEQHDRQSPILILGDSYSDIYRAVGAGIASQLYARLGFEMDRIAVANGGANTVWQSVARRRDNLKGKRLVIWIFRGSEFTNLNFRSIEIFED